MKKFLLIVFLIFCQCCFAENIVILHTSDIHGRLIPVEYKGQKDLGGFSRRVTFFNEIKQNNKNILIFDSGDYSQGSLFYSFDKGKLSMKLMPLAYYDAMTLGNHEFDDGIKTLKQNLKANTTPVICANVEFQDKYLQKRVRPYILKEIDDEKILIIGVTTSKLSNLSNGENVKVKRASIAVNNIINKVMADKIIIISHCGKIEDEEILEVNPEIDLILGGHNHLLMQNDNKIFQDGEFGICTGIYNFDTEKGLTSYERKLINDKFLNDADTDKKLGKINKKVLKVKNTILCPISEKLIATQSVIEQKQTNFGHLIVKSMGNVFNNNYDFIILNAGCIRLNRDLENQITYADVLELLPFNDKIVLGKIEGKYLKNILKTGQKSGRQYLQVIKNTDIIENDKIYTVITSEYLSRGSDDFEDFKKMQILKKTKKTLPQIFTDYIKKNEI